MDVILQKQLAWLNTTYGSKYFKELRYLIFDNRYLPPTYSRTVRIPIAVLRDTLPYLNRFIFLEQSMDSHKIKVCPVLNLIDIAPWMIYNASSEKYSYICNQLVLDIGHVCIVCNTYCANVCIGIMPMMYLYLDSIIKLSR